jgi:hypothetical protein
MSSSQIKVKLGLGGVKATGSAEGESEGEMLDWCKPGPGSEKDGFIEGEVVISHKR